MKYRISIKDSNGKTMRSYVRVCHNGRDEAEAVAKRIFDEQKLTYKDAYWMNSYTINKVRKVIFQYVIVGNYGYGDWDYISSSDTYAEAKADLKCYRENERGASFRLLYCKFWADTDLYDQLRQRDYKKMLWRY